MSRKSFETNVYQISPRSVVLLASRGQPDGFAGVAQYLLPLGAAKVADLQGKGLFKVILLAYD